MITTVTLNTSIDKAYFMKRSIENGTVMRVDENRNSAGGKGLNVARIVRLCGEEVLATGLAGGYNGSYLESLLEQDKIPYDFEHVAGETRSCINILDEAYGSTEYLEPGCMITETEEESFLKRFPDIIRESEVVTLSGSAPRGMSKDIYKKLVEIIKAAGKQVILDTSGAFLEYGLEAHPTMVKPNQDEIELLFHTKIKDRQEVIDYARKIYETGIPYVVISLGGDGALLVCRDGIYQGKPPKIEVVNTVGCGDSMVGAFAVALCRGYDAETMLRYAVSVASANAMSAHTGEFDPQISEKLMQGTEIMKLQ